MERDTLTAIYVHLVFSTKERRRLISREIQPRLWAYLGGVARHNGVQAVEIGGRSDHVHALIQLPPTVSLSKAVQQIKGASSRWFHEQFGKRVFFSWQAGYGAFSVSPSQVDKVRKYIREQEVHHHKMDFGQEWERLTDVLRQAPLRGAEDVARAPGSEEPGYCQTSLRDEQHLHTRAFGSEEPGYSQTSLLDEQHFHARAPGSDEPGYSQTSLRDDGDFVAAVPGSEQPGFIQTSRWDEPSANSTQ